MAHIHLEDGAFTLTWAAIWWAAALIIIAVCLIWLRNVRKSDSRLITLAGLLTAATFVVFQIEIPLFGGVHLSLTPLIGILAGPAIGGIIVLIVNVFSAAIGHEGWSIIGANMLVNMSEVVTAYLIYRWLSEATKMRALYPAGISAFIALFAGNLVMIAVIMISGIQGKQIIASDLAFIAAANMVMAVVEAVVTGNIVEYIRKIRPDMLATRRRGE